LRQKLLAGHVRRQPQLVVLRPHADDDAVIRFSERVDQLLHQRDVGRAEAAEAQIEQSATGSPDMAPDLVRPADARAKPLPGRPEPARPLVVSVYWIEVEVQERRLVDELEVRQRWSTALDAELAELSL